MRVAILCLLFLSSTLAGCFHTDHPSNQGKSSTSTSVASSTSATNTMVPPPPPKPTQWNITSFDSSTFLSPVFQASQTSPHLLATAFNSATGENLVTFLDSNTQTWQVTKVNGAPWTLFGSWAGWDGSRIVFLAEYLGPQGGLPELGAQHVLAIWDGTWKLQVDPTQFLGQRIEGMAMSENGLAILSRSIATGTFVNELQGTTWSATPIAGWDYLMVPDISAAQTGWRIAGRNAAGEQVVLEGAQGTFSEIAKFPATEERGAGISKLSDGPTLEIAWSASTPIGNQYVARISWKTSPPESIPNAILPWDAYATEETGWTTFSSSGNRPMILKWNGIAPETCKDEPLTALGEVDPVRFWVNATHVMAVVRPRGSIGLTIFDVQALCPNSVPP